VLSVSGDYQFDSVEMYSGIGAQNSIGYFDDFWFVATVTGLPGPQGPAGNTGPQGIAGPQGPQGPKGDTGATGPQGTAGPQGSQGPKGDTGATGPQGTAGPQGSQGPKGDTGATGPQGIAGAPGPPAHTSAFCSSFVQPGQAVSPCSKTPVAFKNVIGGACQITADTGSCNASSSCFGSSCNSAVCSVCAP